MSLLSREDILLFVPYYLFFFFEEIDWCAFLTMSGDKLSDLMLISLIRRINAGRVPPRGGTFLSDCSTFRRVFSDVRLCQRNVSSLFFSFYLFIFSCYVFEEFLFLGRSLGLISQRVKKIYKLTLFGFAFTLSTFMVKQF